MRAKLVIDMPKHCLYCPCHKPDLVELWGVCLAKLVIDGCQYMTRKVPTYKRPEWCPLEPIETVGDYLKGEK